MSVLLIILRRVIIYLCSEQLTETQTKTHIKVGLLFSFP